MAIYLVETYSIHKVQYLVEASTDSAASDLILSGKAEEFAQDHLDENIFSSWEIDREEADAVLKNSNIPFEKALNNAT